MLILISFLRIKFWNQGFVVCGGGVCVVELHFVGASGFVICVFKLRSWQIFDSVLGENLCDC